MTIHVNKNEIYLDANDYDSMKQLHLLALSLSASRGWGLVVANPFDPAESSGTGDRHNPPKPPAPSGAECVVL